MALTVAVGFVVDDAIVMIENVEANRERGMSRMSAALDGSRQIGFTVVSISLSLVAAFIPVLFMTGIAGRLLHEFALTLTFAIVISAVVSLTVTPMICAHFIKEGAEAHRNLADRIFEGALGLVVSAYAFTLRIALRNQLVMLSVFIATIFLTVHFYAVLPKGFLPEDDTGLIIAATEAAPDVSFADMKRLQDRALKVIADPAVDNIGSLMGAGGFNPTQNQGRMFISLKPLDERGNVPTAEVIDRLRKPLGDIVGLATRLMPSRDIRAGARSGKADYQYTLWSLNRSTNWRNGAESAFIARHSGQIVDVTSDKEKGGLRAHVNIDRNAASRLNVPISDIDTALSNAFSQTQFSTIYTDRNQYKVVIETPKLRQRDISDLAGVYVTSANKQQVPLTALARVERSSMPLVVNHQGVLPAVTISYNVAPGSTLDAATCRRSRKPSRCSIRRAACMRAGDAADFRKVAKGMATLILAALLAVYIVLGILYESLVHPIDDHLDAAFRRPRRAARARAVRIWTFTVIAFIGILLIGIVKKNGIMLVDFALHAERDRGLSVRDAALEAARERFRPIVMTTLRGACSARCPSPSRRASARAAPSARHHHHRRPAAQPGADALHDAGLCYLLSAPAVLEDQRFQRQARGPAFHFEFRALVGPLDEADAEIGDDGDFFGNSENCPQILLAHDAHPANADAFRARREPEILNGAGRAQKIGVGLLRAAEPCRAMALAVAGHANIDRGFENAFELKVSVVIAPRRIEHPLLGLGAAQKGPMNLAAHRGVSYHDEIPRLHEADGRRVMRRVEDAQQQFLRHLLGQELIAHVAARIDRAIDGGAIRLAEGRGGTEFVRGDSPRLERRFIRHHAISRAFVSRVQAASPAGRPKRSHSGRSGNARGRMPLSQSRINQSPARS